MNVPKFVLASASVARRKLLLTAGIEPIIYKSNFDESQVKIDHPIRLVETLALSKAQVVAKEFHDALILGCDSILFLDGQIYGKPKDAPEAIARWQKMRGKQGTLYTGHALIDQTQNRELIDCGVTQVYFADVNYRTIEAYVNSGEPLNCAGSFALEGKGGLLVERIEGCHSNIIGLSLPLLRQMLSQLGYEISSFWRLT